MSQKNVEKLEKVEVFCAYIVRKGKKIPPPKGKKVWHFWVTPKAKT